MDGNDVWLLESELAFVGMVGGLGWLIALVALEHKRKREQWSVWQTTDEFLRVTFTSVTFVAVVQLAVQVAIHLPDWLENVQRDAIEEIVERTERAIERAQPTKPTMPEVPKEEDVARAVEELLAPRLDALSAPPSVGFLEAAAKLRRDGVWDERELQRLVDFHFGMKGVRTSWEGVLQFDLDAVNGSGFVLVLDQESRLVLGGTSR